jgi:KDO2-lipid IV(A) lauroyltransferase
VNIGPAVLAARADALVLPLFILRREDHYLLLTDEPLDAATLPGNHEERAVAVARFYTEAVERRVRACPEQWFWMHKRWKTRPQDETA